MSGDVAIRLDGPTGLVVKTVSGDAIVEGSRVDRFAFTTTSGDPAYERQREDLDQLDPRKMMFAVARLRRLGRRRHRWRDLVIHAQRRFSS